MSIGIRALRRAEEGNVIRSVAFNAFKMKGTDGKALQKENENGSTMISRIRQEEHTSWVTSGSCSSGT